MEMRDGEALKRFAREHHVHYEVEPATVDGGQPPRLAGFELHVFAGHDGAKLEVPGCPRCVELTRELRSFVEQIVSSGDLGERAAIVPEPPAVYQSTEERDADEVRVTVRVRCDPAGERRTRAADDACMAELRERLAAAGVPRH